MVVEDPIIKVVNVTGLQVSSPQNVLRQSCISSEKEIKRGVSGRGMNMTVISHHKLRKILLPIALPLWRQSSKHIMHRSIESLALSVALGVIWARTTLGDAIDTTEFFDNTSFKAAPLV